MRQDGRQARGPALPHAPNALHHLLQHRRRRRRRRVPDLTQRVRVPRRDGKSGCERQQLRQRAHGGLSHPRAHIAPLIGGVIAQGHEQGGDHPD